MRSHIGFREKPEDGKERKPKKKALFVSIISILLPTLKLKSRLQLISRSESCVLLLLLFSFAFDIVREGNVWKNLRLTAIATNKQTSNEKKVFWPFRDKWAAQSESTFFFFSSRISVHDVSNSFWGRREKNLFWLHPSRVFLFSPSPSTNICLNTMAEHKESSRDKYWILTSLGDGRANDPTPSSNDYWLKLKW